MYDEAYTALFDGLHPGPLARLCRRTCVLNARKGRQPVSPRLRRRRGERSECLTAPLPARRGGQGLGLRRTGARLM
jgi:hypothetical protein